MTDSEVLCVFCKKIRANYQAFYRDWFAMTPEELIRKADFVQATKAMYEYYKNGCSDTEAMRYLIGFENPLEILRDGFVLDMACDVNSIKDSLSGICARRNADDDYEKDYRYFEAPKPRQEMPFGM